VSCKDQYPEPPGGIDLSVICIDLDGTIAEDTWPRPYIGEPIPEGIAALRHYAQSGWAVVIYTARPWSHADRIWDWIRRHNLHHWVYDVVCGKPAAAGYLDDKAMEFRREAK